MNLEIKYMLTRYYLHIIGLISPNIAGNIAARIFTTPTRVPAPAREEEYLSDAEEMVLKSGCSGYVWGKNGTRGNILLVHGWSGRGGQLGRFGQALSKLGYTVYAFDGPAHGRSPGQTTDPRRFAEFIMSTALEVGGLVGIIGHSFGAGASVVAVSLGLKIDKLVYIAGPYSYKDILIEFADAMQLDPSVREVFYHKLSELVGVPLDDMVLGKIIRKAPQVKGLIIHDELDDIVPVAKARMLHQDWEDSELFITKGLGHRKILHDGVVAEKVCNFFLED